MNKNIYWGMEERSLRVHLENLESIETMPFTAKDVEAISLRSESDRKDRKKESIISINGDTAEIKIIGILSRTGPSWIEKFFGINGTSYNEIISSVREAIENPIVNKIILKMNTPGGVMSGVDEVWQEVKKASGIKKVIAENNGLIASAGYYIASAANKITATSPLGMVGSIGVMLVTYDYTEAMKERGIKKINIISKNAPEKNPDLTTKKGTDVIQKEIDALERVMINRIAVGRGLNDEYVSQNFGRGSLLINKDPDGKNIDAVKAKMIDYLTFSENYGNIEEDNNNDNNQSREEIFLGTPAYKDYEIVDKPWDADNAIKRVRSKTGSDKEPSKEYKNAFFWYDPKDVNNFGAYKLPFVDVIDGKLVAIRSGIFTADRAMKGARTGKAPDIPEKDRPSVQSHIDRYKTKIEKQDKKKKEKNAMNSLKEAMEQYPGIKAEIEARDKEIEARGRQSEKDTIVGRINRALPFIGSDAYPKAVSEYAKKVILGEASPDGLDAVVAACDAQKETMESQNAKKETDGLSETQGTHLEQGNTSTDGKIRNPEDVKASNEELKKFL